MQWNDLYQQFELQLSEWYDKPEIQAIFYGIFEKYSGLNKIHFYTHRFEEIPTNSLPVYLSSLNSLTMGKPLQYILNDAPFYQLSFYVNSDVLIPRPETEELVDWILQDLRMLNARDKNLHRMENDKELGLTLLDIGTGSGCIPISIKFHAEKIGVKVQAHGIDISENVLKVAQLNATNLNTELTLKNLDILNKDNWNDIPNFDIIVSNPPYISPSEAEAMHQNVLKYEPYIALFVPEESDPLIFYRLIATLGLSHLKAKGYLYFEINPLFNVEMEKLLIQLGYKNIECRNDMQGKPRMIRAQKY
ncbi:MAG: peptide chain release factor N(5)-glutamine methyltransferase [Pedobacter sp.]|nr:MAG: peptide chain release factor N(5)-glutamine methyltransferase [Pedobacter sp.]